MPGPTGDDAFALRSTDGDSIKAADARSRLPSVQFAASSRTLEFTAQCAKVTGGGRIVAAHPDDAAVPANARTEANALPGFVMRSPFPVTRTLRAYIPRRPQLMRGKVTPASRVA